MKIPYSWLKEYINLEDIDVNDFAKKLTVAGSEVSSIDTAGGNIPGVVVGKVVSVHKHSDADRLTVCNVDIGNGDFLSIVCGAPNIQENILVPVATAGTKLPNGQTVKNTSIRGFESNGMICSKKELEYIDDSDEDGIWILDDTLAQVGGDASSILDSIEYILNIEITANRGDMLGIIGFARECSVVLGQRVSLPSVEEFSSIGGNIDITIENPDLCSKYVARLISNTTIIDSPLWMQNRLKACGIKSINNVVDATNYVMHEYGQPIHAFDYDKIVDKKIIIRNAVDGEKIILLDGKEVELKSDMLVIADSEKPIAIAGVMGGLETSITESTKNILVESACFDDISVRCTSSALGIKTDASYHFERGVDYKFTQPALNRVVELIMSLDKNAEIASHAKELNGKIPEDKHILFDCDLVKRYLSLDITRLDIVSLFKQSGFDSSAFGENSLKVDIPNYRRDLSIPVDLIEEIARLYGYDNIGTEIPKIKSNSVESDYYEISKLKHLMAFHGFWETKQYSMGFSGLYSKLGFNEEMFVNILNPLSSDLDILRPTTFASLMKTIAYNQSRRNKSGAIFEVGNVFYKNELGEYKEEKRLSATMFGSNSKKLWNNESRPYDFFDLSGVLESMLDNLNAKEYKLIVKENQLFVPNQYAEISIFGEIIGYIGRVHPKTLSIFNITDDVFFFDIDAKYLINILKEKSSSPYFNDMGKYPAVYRDLALVCDKNKEFADVLNDIKNFNSIIKEVYVVDRYVGDQMESGKASVAISITYFDSTKTLKENDVNRVEAELLEMLSKKYSIVIRS